MESRRLHEEFSNVSRHQNGPANIIAKACVSNSLINLATHKMHGDAMSGGLETTLNFQTDSTGHIQLLPVLSIRILVLMQSFNEFLSVVILRRGPVKTPSTPPMANTKRFTPESSVANL